MKDMALKKKSEKLDLLTAMEQIAVMAKGSKLSETFFDKANIYITSVANKLQLTKKQGVPQS